MGKTAKPSPQPAPRPSTPAHDPNGAGYPSTTGNPSGKGRGNN
ncbi:MAG: hypothetical protein ACFNQF_00075 [Bacteroides sp.]